LVLGVAQHPDAGHAPPSEQHALFSATALEDFSEQQDWAVVLATALAESQHAASLDSQQEDEAERLQAVSGALPQLPPKL
jgi:hypothetical protein